MTLWEILYEAFGREHCERLEALGPETASPKAKAATVKAATAADRSFSKERIETIFEAHRNTLAEFFVDPDARLTEIIHAVKADCPLSRSYVTSLLGKCRTTRARRLLHWLIVEDPAFVVRSTALAAIGNNATDADIELLLEVLDLPEAEEEPLRGWDGMRRLRLYGGPHGVRAGAAEGLGIAKARSAVEPLLAHISDRHSSSLQWRAIHALGEIGDPRAIEPLKQLQGELDCYSEMQRQTVSRTISRALNQLSAA